MVNYKLWSLVIIIIVLDASKFIHALECYVCLNSENPGCPKPRMGASPYILEDCTVDKAKEFFRLTSRKIRRSSEGEGNMTEDNMVHDLNEFDLLTLTTTTMISSDMGTASTEMTVPISGASDDELVPVCRKNEFYVHEDVYSKSRGVEIKKRMTMPRIQYSCGLEMKKDAESCISRKNPEYNIAQCSCSTDRCNKSPGIAKPLFGPTYLITFLFLIDGLAKLGVY